MQERVQLNISVTREQKLALQALAEGHGTSVTKLVLGLIEVPQAAAVVVSSRFEAERVAFREAAEDEAAVQIEAAVAPSPRVIESPADVPAAVRRAASPEEARAFAPYSKEQQTGKTQKKKLAQAEPVKSCRHGLLRCKVCGSG